MMLKCQHYIFYSGTLLGISQIVIPSHQTFKRNFERFRSLHLHQTISKQRQLQQLPFFYSLRTDWRQPDQIMFCFQSHRQYLSNAFYQQMIFVYFSFYFNQQLIVQTMIEESMPIEKNNNQLYDQVSLQSILTHTYNVKSRRKKDFLYKVYKCLCNHRHHSKQQMRRHKLKCQKRKYKKNKYEQLAEVDEQIGQSIIQQNSINNTFFNEFQDLKRRLEFVEKNQQNFSSISTFDAFHRAKNIFEKYSSAIQGILINKLAASLENGHRANIKIAEIQNSIAAAFIGKLHLLNFDDCVQVLSDKFHKAHKSLMQQSENKKIKTKRYNQRAYNFLCQFNEFQLGTQIRLFDQMIKIQPTQRRNVYRYFSQIRKIDPYFGKFPALPKLFKSIPRGIMLSKVTLQQAALQIRTIYLNNFKTLACDMWLIATLGLRFLDLLKVKFILQDGSIVKFIKLREQKNKNICERYIPLSLISMIVESQTIYPATQKRLRLAVKECLSRFKSSYGFKHRAITAILSALHRSNPLGRMHSNPLMTTNHYINHNDQKFIDQAFNVGINFVFSEKIRKMISERDTILDLTEQTQAKIKISSFNLGQITLQCNNIYLDRLVTTALDGQFDTDSYSQHSNIFLQSISVSQLSQISLISSNHHIQIPPQRYPTFQEAISSLDQQYRIVEATEQLVAEVGEDVDDQLFSQQLSQVTGRAVYFYQFNEVQSTLEKEVVFNQQLKQVEPQIVISKSRSSYSIYSTSISLNTKRLSAIKARQNITTSAYTHKPFAPNCFDCIATKKYSKIKSTNSGIQCNLCGWKQETIGNMYPYQQQIQISFINPDQIKGYRCVKLVKQKNNLIEVINKQFNGRLGHFCQYTNDFPKKINTTFKKASNYFQKQILKCRKKVQFLPLKIELSAIPNAGYGVFASQKILKDQLLLTYEGLIGTSFSIIDKQRKNSLFEAGWVSSKKNKNIQFQVLIDGQEIVGPGRFINSSLSRHSSNVTASTVIFRGQILIYFYTLRQIQKNEQVLFYYGSKYWENEVKKPKIVNYDQSIQSQEDEHEDEE